MVQPCIVIPVYNHEHAIASVVEALQPYGLPCILVDDGSRAECAAVLDELATRAGVELVRLAHNSGKGAAVLAGMHHAQDKGYTHAIQIDADGQHDTNAITTFLDASRKAPGTLIAGKPVYDASVPKTRLYGRYLTHVWVWINTLSLQIEDSMCGFRVYPLAATLAVAQQQTIGQRMDFDTEIMVRLYWSGMPVVQLPVAVRYPLDGVSHFDTLRDNLRISKMHTRLFFGMLRRIPRLIRLRQNAP